MTTSDHFADLIDARDGVHPERGNWTPGDDTEEPDAEFLRIEAEDTFGILIEEGHGVRVHKTDKPWLGKLDTSFWAELAELETAYSESDFGLETFLALRADVLSEHNIHHRMVDELTLATDVWEQPFERPEEDLTPFSAGPWNGAAMDEFGVVEDAWGFEPNACGMEALCHDDEFCAETWDILRDAHVEEQRALAGLDRAFRSAIRVSELSAAKEQRQLRFETILAWFSTAAFKEVQCHKGRFWQKVNRSRKLAGERGLWGYIYLTKQQVDAINEVIRFRTDEYQDAKFGRRKK